MNQRRAARGSMHALLALVLLLLALPSIADAGRRSGPQYNDPPSYQGPRRAPRTRPAPAPPNGPTATLSGLGRYPDLVVDEAGTAHIVWTEDRGDADDAARYCRLKRGATACDTQATLTWAKSYDTGDHPQFNQDNGGPRIVRVGEQLVIFSKRYPTIGEKPDGASSSTTLAWTSEDGGTSWRGPAVIGKRDLGNLVVVGPAEDPTILNFGFDPLCEAPGPSRACIQAYKSAQYSRDSGNLTTARDENYSATMALDETRLPVAAVSDLERNALVRRWSGNGSPLDPAQWSANKFPGNDVELAGGPAGVFLLSRPNFFGAFDVRKLNRQPDGVMTPGPSVKITGDDDGSAFGELAQDPAGRLHAAWSTSRFDRPGVKLRSTRSAPGENPDFAPVQTVADGVETGQLALDAAADGGGFVAYNQTGGATKEGEVKAVGFGQQASTGQLGLGDLPPGSGSIDQTCRRARFGSFTIDAVEGCFVNGTGANRDVVVTTREVNLHGLRIIPDPDTKLVIDHRRLRVDTIGGYAKVLVTAPGIGDVVLWHGPIHRDLSGARPGDNLFEFPAAEYPDAEIFGFDIPSNIPVRLETDGVHIPIEVTLPRAFGGFTGKAELVSDRERGLHPDSLTIRIGPLPIGALMVESMELFYTGGKVWGGPAAVSVLGKGRIETTARFVEGRFEGARANYTPAPPVTIGPFVSLRRFNGGFFIDDPRLAANAQVGAGAPIRGEPPITNDGDFTMLFPSNGPGKFTQIGDLTVMIFGAPQGTLNFSTDGYADFHGRTHFDIGPLFVDAMMDGFVDDQTGQFGATLTGDIKVCFSIDGSPELCPGVGGDAVLSSVGFAACADESFDPPGPVEPISASGGFAYRWDQFEGEGALRSALTSSLLTAVRTPCSTEGFTIPPPQAKKAQAGGGRAVSVPAGLPSYTIALEGDGGVPRVAVTGPNGFSFNSDEVTPAAYMVKPRGMNAGYVVLNRPAAGTYTVTPLDGSPAIKQTLVSSGFVPATVRSASLRGRGRARSIAYRVANLGSGQRVVFTETGRFGTRIIGSTTKSRGTLKFKPADATGGRREVVALVEHDGFVIDRSRVGFYTAPRPSRPRTVSGLKARRKGTSVTVSWKRVPGASRYVVRLRGRKRGTGTARLVPGRAKKVRIPAVRKDDRITIQVRVVSPKLRQGAGRTVRLKPSRR